MIGRKAGAAVCKLAGLPGKRLHDCRRTAARNLIRSGRQNAWRCSSPVSRWERFRRLPRQTQRHTQRRPEHLSIQSSNGPGRSPK
jgi:hypothetical protein